MFWLQVPDFIHLAMTCRYFYDLLFYHRTRNTLWRIVIGKIGRSCVNSRKNLKRFIRSKYKEFSYQNVNIIASFFSNSAKIWGCVFELDKNATKSFYIEKMSGDHVVNNENPIAICFLQQPKKITRVLEFKLFDARSYTTIDDWILDNMTYQEKCDNPFPMKSFYSNIRVYWPNVCVTTLDRLFD